MKNKNLFIIYLTLVIYLIIGGTGLNNAILCFGEDGHIKVEFTLCNNPAEASTTIYDKHFTGDPDGLTHDTCGKCTDIPLFTDKTDNQNILNIQTLKLNNENNTIYFYYPVQVCKSENKYDKLPFFEQLRLDNPQFTFINTTTTVLLN